MYATLLTREVYILPFLKKKQEAAISMPVVQHMGETSPLMSAAHDLMQAIEAKDEKGVAAALKAAFRQLDQEPADEAAGSDSQSE